MTLSSLIVNRIIRDGSVTLDDLETRAHKRGVSLSELYAALDHVARDKRIEAVNLKDGVTYRLAKPKATQPQTHIAWVKQWYADNEPHDVGDPFPEIDLSWMFLRTKDERDAYHAAAKGVPQYMLKSKHGKKGVGHTA